MNFHLKQGIYFRKTATGGLSIVKATYFDDAGEVIVEMSVSEFASIVSGFTSHQEANGSFAYILDFLENGAMYCGGCGARLLPGVDASYGMLSIVNLVSCTRCYETKFKPLFDWGSKYIGDGKSHRMPLPAYGVSGLSNTTPVQVSDNSGTAKVVV